MKHPDASFVDCQIPGASPERDSPRRHETASPAPLGGLVLRGAAWAVGLKVAVYVLSALKLVVLARLLPPAELGVVAMALIAVAVTETFTVTGVDVALVQRSGVGPAQLNAAWTLNVARGLVLTVALVLIAGPTARFFGAPALAAVLRVMAVAVFARGLVNPGIVAFTRELDFARLTALQIAETVADATVAIGATIVLRSAWGLVAGVLAAAATRAVLSFVLHPFRPRLTRDLAEIAQFTRFGRWVWGNNVLVFLGARLDGLVVGKALGPAALGAYDAARKLGDYLTRQIIETASQITFPAYARLQHDVERLRRAYLLTSRACFAVTLPLVLLALLAGHALVEAVLGPAWHGAAAAVGLLAAAGFVRGMAAAGNWLAYAVGRPAAAVAGMTARTIVLGLLIVPLTSGWGLQGASWAVLAANVALIVPGLIVVKQAVGVGPLEYLRQFYGSLLLGGLVFGSTFLIGVVLGVSGPLASLALGIISVCLYGCVVAFVGGEPIPTLTAALGKKACACS